MLINIFRALNELTSCSGDVDKHLEMTSTTNYPKSAHRITNLYIQNMSLLLLYITHLVTCQCSHLHANLRVKHLIHPSHSKPTKWMQIPTLSSLSSPCQQEVLYSDWTQHSNLIQLWYILKGAGFNICSSNTISCNFKKAYFKTAY